MQLLPAVVQPFHLTSAFGAETRRERTQWRAPDTGFNLVEFFFLYISVTFSLAEKPIWPAVRDNKGSWNLYDRLHHWVQITKSFIASVGVISHAWQISSDRERTADTSPVNKVI